MVCKWCGMESASTDKCSWCNRTLTKDSSAKAGPLANSAAVDQASDADKMTAASNTSEESALPIAPWTISPPETSVLAAPTIPVTSTTVPNGTPPMIGIRKQGTTLGGLPAPARRPVGSPVPPTRESARPAGHVPAPAAPLSHTPRRKPPTPASPSAAGPSTSQAAPPNGTTALPSVVRPGRVMLNNPVEATPEPMPTISMPAASSASGNSEPSAPGLADGVAAPSRIEAALDNHAPDFGTFTATKSKYYSGAVIDPYSGTHYDADTGKVLSSPGLDSKIGGGGRPVPPANTRNAARRTAGDITLNWDKPLPPMSTLILKFAAIFAGILAVSSLAAHTMPGNYVLPLVVSQFFGALMLPIVRVTPWAEEDTDDFGLFILLILAGSFVILCGPVIAFVIYVIISLVRQNTNPSVVACLAVASIARVIMEIAATGWSTALFTPLGSTFSMKLLFISWTGLVPLAGLYAASIFRKLDD